MSVEKGEGEEHVSTTGQFIRVHRDSWCKRSDDPAGPAGGAEGRTTALQCRVQAAHPGRSGSVYRTGPDRDVAAPRGAVQLAPREMAPTARSGDESGAG